jgi:SAM-dependent methyltransferase
MKVYTMGKILRFIIRIIRRTGFTVRQFYFKIAGSEVQCNICHFRSNKFESDDWHLYSVCPNCGSNVRQRLLVASFDLLNQFSYSNLIQNKRILHFAPEDSISKLIKKRALIYKTADFLTDGYSYNYLDFNIDISDMQEIEDESYDCVIACDVLEHVPDYILGIKEVLRILRSGGYCIFTVPQKDKLSVTLDDKKITDPIEREKTFGQSDHLRIFGDDFVNRLENCGFKVTVINERSFDENTVKKHVLFPPVLSKHPLATNYRKVFFGRK